MKKILPIGMLVTCLLLATTASFANDNSIKLRSGEVLIQTAVPSIGLSTYENKFNNNYVIIQFNNIPTAKEKNNLELNGVQLLEYIPEKAFIAELENTSTISIGELNINGIIPFKAEYKLSKAIAASDYPDWATSGSEVSLMVESHLNVDRTEFINFLQSNQVEILSIDPSGVYSEVKVNKDQIDFLASAPMVKAIDFISAPPEEEDTRGRSLHRGNMLDSDHPLGRKYDGSGVSIAIADDAVIGPHIDIKGRVTSFSSNPNGTHGDMTTGIAMGAGNLNPDYRGMATGAYLYYYDIGGYPHIANAAFNLVNRGVMITSTSFSEGCNAGYTSTTRTVDQQTRANPTLLHVFSAGNSSGSTCGSNAYGAGTPWGTITGGRKQGKATIATGNVFYTGTLVSSSSRGPAADGRIKPDICANGGQQRSTNANNTYQIGGGTSAASPGIAGLAAQMYQGYRDLNGGSNPESALIKSAMLNTARDLGNPGPDFTYGWGRVNAHRAMQLIEDGRYLDSNISQNGSNSHSVVIPANLEELKFMIYWTDWEGSTIATKALVNDLDFKVITPTGDTILPWVLDPTPNATNLSRNAVRGSDNLNNMEQVSIDTINAGTYTLLVDGTTVPQGPQKYYIVWETKTDEITVTYPHGGEGFTPGTTETIRWDATGTTGTTIIEYSTDTGVTWSTISVTNGLARFRDWVVPNNVTGNALIRITKGSRVGVSANPFSIVGVPTNIQTDFRCPDSIKLTWNSVPGATGYEIFLLGATHMDSVGVSSTNDFILRNLNLADDNWVSVRAFGGGITGKRANAVLLGKSIDNCPFSYDVAVTQFTSPASDIYPNCGNTKAPITVSIANNGDSVLQNIVLRLNDGISNYFDTIAGPLNSGMTMSYTFNDSLDLSAVNSATINVVSLFPGDQNSLNDSIALDVDVLNTVFTLPYTNDFESFNICSSNFDCGLTICNLNGGWVNAQNGVGDDIDLRSDFGGTPSNGTGPSIDHNPGTSIGRYLYSEASNGCNGAEAITITPCFDLSNTIAPEFSFWYHMNGTAVGSLTVDVFSNGVWTNNIAPALNGSQGNLWRQRVINMSAYTGQIVNFRITVTTGISWSSDIAIDDVEFIDRSTGLDVVDANQAFKIYPNPSDGIFTLQFDEVPQNNIQIIDINGRIVEEMRVNTTNSNIDLSSYEKGVYFLTIMNTGIREKIIVY